MKIKRILALALATTMVFGASLTVFADGESSTGTDINSVTTDNKGVYASETTVAANLETPIIHVVVPKTAEVALNPYHIGIVKDAVKKAIGLEGEAAGGTEIASALAADDTKIDVVAPTYKIFNLSNVPMKVTPTITVKATGVTLLDAVPEANDTKNKTTKWAAIKATFGDSDVKLGHVYGKTAGDDQPTFDMEAGTFNADKKCTAADSVDLVFSGSLNSPENVATSWTASEKLEISIKYVFAPQVIPAD